MRTLVELGVAQGFVTHDDVDAHLGPQADIAASLDVLAEHGIEVVDPAEVTPDLDGFLQHASAVVRAGWAEAIPLQVLDLWVASGDAERTYAVAQTTPRGNASLLATYAALDRDPVRSRRMARTALVHAHGTRELASVVLVVPLADEGVLAAVHEASCRLTRGARDDLPRELPRVRHPGLTLPDLELLADHPALLGWAATRSDPAVRLAILERAWAHPRAGDPEHVWPLLLATRELEAWLAVPAEHRALAARLLALDGATDQLAALADATESESIRGQILAAAMIRPETVPAAWIDGVRACGASAEQEYEAGLITELERDQLRWAVEACGGIASTHELAVRALVAAHAAASGVVTMLAEPASAPREEPVSAKRLLAMVEKARAEHPRRISRGRALYMVVLAGQAGQADLVRQAIDQLETVFGRFTDLEYDTSAIEALTFYPGRSRELVSQLGTFAGGSTQAMVAAGLARDGHLALARRHARKALQAPPGSLGPASLATIADLVLDGAVDARDRFMAIMAEVLAELPGGSRQAATAWLDEPCESLEPRADAAPVVARSPELEASLAAADEPDLATSLVYADFLESRGDPRGPLIQLHQRHKLAEAARWLQRYRDHFLGPLARYTTCLDGIAVPAFTWELGFIRSARIAYAASVAGELTAHEDLSVAHALDTLLVHPSGALLRELTVAVDIIDGQCDFGPAIEAIARHGAPALRRLRIGELRHAGPRAPTLAIDYELSWARFTDLGGLWPRLPRLESLVLQGALGEPVLGDLALPRLRSLTLVTPALHRDTLHAIATAPWPALETLELWLGPRSEDPADLDAIVTAIAQLHAPRLHTLRLLNSGHANELVAALACSAVLPQLRELGLALGTLDDAGAIALAQQAARFGHLDVLDLEASSLSETGIAAVEDLCAEVRVDDQKDPASERYVSVTE